MKKLFILLLLSLSLNALNYVGDKECQSCHKQEHKDWSGSHHDLAMQNATKKTVLGDFNDTTFNYNGIITTFFKKNARYMVNTDGADGKLQDFEISYTFGVYPLQQYMINFPDGKVQVLTIAWDSRAKIDGGQRWFHIHQDDNVTVDDVLHWSGPNLNWNYMCADCHSTNLKKNYDHKTKKYNTRYEQMNVSCEECHGAGSKHIKWANNPEKHVNTLRKGLKNIGKKNHWKIDSKTMKPYLDGEIDRTEVLACAKCHSRRTQFGDDFENAKSFHDNYRLATLSEQLYFKDGKIKDEVYVYGSFVQSKMYEAGVTCSDCHNPHSLERKAVGDNVCNQCHVRVNYDNPKHTKHKKGSASCIDCHMPSRVYMGVDERNDHSFRVPRPDLSDALKAPNACNNCHKDKTNTWSTSAMKKWYGEIPKGHQNFSHALVSTHKTQDSALQDLYSVLMSDAPDIAKATVVPYLGVYPSRQTHMTTLQKLASKDATMRIAALQSLQSFPVQFIMKDIVESLSDEVRSVRLEATRILMNVDTRSLSEKEQILYNKARKEYKESLLFLADRAESQVALATYYIRTNNVQNAIKSYNEGIRIQKFYVPSYVNYANLLQAMGKEDESLSVINRGLANVKDASPLLESLGLWYIRNNQKEKGIDVLEKAAFLNKEDARLQYLYAVAISGKDRKKAIDILNKSLQSHSGDVASLNALIHYHTQEENFKLVALYKKKLENIFKISILNSK